MTHCDRALQILILVFQDEQRALLEILYQILEDLELAEVGALMNKRVAAVVCPEDELVNLDVVQATEDIDKRIDVSLLNC